MQRGLQTSGQKTLERASFPQRTVGFRANQSQSRSGLPLEKKDGLLVQNGWESKVGLEDGVMVGITLGEEDGVMVGTTLGEEDGVMVGITLGEEDGVMVGITLGEKT
jgi:hypothetical protein